LWQYIQHLISNLRRSKNLVIGKVCKTRKHIGVV
jgi:hypothetical protein